MVRALRAFWTAGGYQAIGGEERELRRLLLLGQGHVHLELHLPGRGRPRPAGAGAVRHPVLPLLAKVLGAQRRAQLQLAAQAAAQASVLRWWASGLFDRSVASGRWPIASSKDKIGLQNPLQ